MVNSGHSAWNENEEFSKKIVSELHPNVIVDLGVHYGDSTFLFCEAAMLEGIYPMIFGIDTFEGDYYTGRYNDVYEYTIKESYKYPLVHIRKETFRKFSEFCKENSISIDLLHVDGSHSYEETKENYELFLPFLREGGCVLFHDTKMEGVKKLFDEITEGKDKDLFYEFDNNYGLGVFYPKGK
ncbi:MAG: class I SAM-dependent methyltransferase [Patescibacteria group bacterium]|nr:class I SAM-dependent methyltransferase [Patescibacteria group bacterium]